MRIHFYKDRSKQWRWTVYAQNGKKLANAGEGYVRLRDCRKTAAKLFAWWTP